MNQLQAKILPQSEAMGSMMTILGLVNGMIGGTILVLPLIGIQTGFIMTLIVCAVLGYLTYYTGYLIVLHLGKAENISISVLAHFNKNSNYLAIYNVCIWSSFIPYFFIYFRLICLQIVGLLGYQSSLIGPIVAISLTIAIILIRIYNCSEEVIGYGIISNITYIVFMIWAQLTAPEGPNTVKPIGDPIKLAGSLITAFSLHNLLAQNMIKNPKRQQYPKLVKYTYIIGTITYIFIAYGSFAMINRIPIRSHPQTINDYFAVGGWQITIIQLVQVVHLFSAFPNFLLISKNSFFQMCSVTIGTQIQWKQILFILFFIMASFTIYIANVHLEIMIVLNGAVVGFTYVFMYPIWIHLKCVFYDKNSGFIEGDDQWNKQIRLNVCECDNTYSSKWTLYLQTLFLICVLILGILFIVFTIFQIVTNPNYHH